MTRAVAREASALEFRQFQAPEDRERLVAIRALAREQVNDDKPSTSGHRRDQIGRAVTGRVVHADPDNGTELWKRWAPEQMALEDAMAPLLRDLSPQQRETVHLLYWGRLTYRQVAAVLKITASPVQGLERRALANLRRAIVTRYLMPDEAAA